MSEEKAPDVAGIAGRLSEAEAEVLCRPFGMSSHAFYPARAHKSCRSLASMGLLTEHQDNIGNPMFRFTPRGLALRNHLMEKNDVAK